MDTSVGDFTRNQSWMNLTNITSTVNPPPAEESPQILSHDEGLVSDTALEEFVVVYRWLMPALCLLAIIFCCINASVYWQQRAANFAVFLFSVDVGDGICATTNLVHSLMILTLPSGAYARQFVHWYLASYMADSGRHAALWMNALVSFERWLVIAFPLKITSKKLVSSPWALVFSVFVLSLIAHVHMPLSYHVVEIHPNGTEAEWATIATELWEENRSVFLVVSTLVGILSSYAPLIITLALNIALVMVLNVHAAGLKHIRRTNGVMIPADKSMATSEYYSCGSETLSHNGTTEVRQTPDGSKLGKIMKGNGTKSNKASRRQQETQTAKMVLVFSIVFVAFALPRMLHASARALLPEYGPNGKEHNLYSVIDLLASISSKLTETALFWTSFAYSRHFRNAFFRLPVARWCCGQWRMEASLATTSSSSTSSGSITKSDTNAYVITNNDDRRLLGQ